MHPYSRRRHHGHEFSAAAERERRGSLVVAGGLTAARVPVVRIPVDAQRFTPLSDDGWTHGLQHPQLVFVGRADDPRKNVPLLLEAFALVRRELPDATLRLIGNPPRSAARHPLLSTLGMLHRATTVA